MSSAETGPFRVHPAYAEYSQFANLLTNPRATAAMRIDVDPLTTGSRYWTFVSITNNDTQRVTLVSPQ
ncbi:MAG TPA: hypothetical protein VF980_02060 [Thermoanaerobaculia bacterium]